MAVTKVAFKPGLNREGTQYSAGPTWFDGDRIRFRKGKVESIGGWTKYSGDSFLGVCRSLLDWGTADSTKYLGVGTNLKFYINRGTDFVDVTPIRLTTAAGDVTFAATNGSSTITVTENNHGAVAGDYVMFTGLDAAGLGGAITKAVLEKEYEIDALDSVSPGDVYTITAVDSNGDAVTANASDTGDGNTGGSTVAEYLLNIGTNTYVGAVGWGTGTYGSSSWGGGGALSLTGQLRLYSQDVFGDDLIFNPRAGGVFYWDESAGYTSYTPGTPASGNRAVSLTDLAGASDAPALALQVMVSPQDRHVICFGVNPITDTSYIDPLLVRWSDQENAADWTPTATNSAGGQVLSTGTQIVGAIKTRHEILIFTDTSIHSMQFSGAPFVYQFSVVSENTSIISPKAAIQAGDAVFFMDREGFYVYQGSVQRLQCPVLDYVYSDIDLEQAYKIYAATNPDHSEVTWYYPDATTGEISRYVTYNYTEDVWTYGTLARGAWIHAPTRTNPVAASNDTTNDAKVNYLYTHESGYDDDGANLGAYVESGAVELGDGDHMMFVRRFIPDLRISGTQNNATLTVKIKGRTYPHQNFGDAGTTEYSSTVVATTQQAHVRVRAREIALRIEADSTGYGWTMGSWRFDVRQDGLR